MPPVKLKQPIQAGSETISELVFRTPKAGDFRGLAGRSETDDTLDLAGKLCGQPPSVIDELGMDDMMEVLNVVGNFMPNSQKTGKPR